MTYERAIKAAQTLEDVFTPDGDAVVIASVGNDDAIVTGRLHHAKLFKLSELTTREDL